MRLRFFLVLFIITIKKDKVGQILQPFVANVYRIFGRNDAM